MKRAPSEPSDVSGRFPEGPVDWALGAVFFESLLQPILYYLVPDRLDPRDWMTGERLSCQREPFGFEPKESQDYWFDFVADTGDSDVAMYSLAYLFHGDLRLVGQAGALEADQPILKPGTEVAAANSVDTERLPRGNFLFVGGDTAYPVAEQATLDARFTKPMNHAFERRFAGSAPPARALLGVPGNHDWYDSLDGFNRIFRRPPRASAELARATPSPDRPDGYLPCQQASYFSLELPGNWQLWALDAREGKDVDFRQHAFFETASSANPPAHLILATPNPALVNGERAAFTDKLFSGLPASARAAARLWFSGNTHHYARYEGLELPGKARVTSLVSGLGSAALHAPLPGGLRAAAAHPSVSDGNRSVLGRLWRPDYMLQRAGLRRLGLVFGTAFGAGASLPSSEVGSWIHSLFGTHPRAELPLVFGILLVSIAAVLWIVLRSRWPSEREARRTPVRKRLGRVGVRAFGVGSLLVLGAFVLERSVGSMLLDVAFELAALLLVVGVLVLLLIGLGSRRSAAKICGVVLVTLVLAALTIAGSIATTLACQAAFAHLGWQAQWLVNLGVVLAPILAGCLMYLLFPVLAGWALALAFVLETQRAFVSSLAAIDRYQAFIRFRLRVDPNSNESWLTGFVIAVTEPVTLAALRESDARSAPIPKAAVMDAFTLHAKGNAS